METNAQNPLDLFPVASLLTGKLRTCCGLGVDLLQNC